MEVDEAVRRMSLAKTYKDRHWVRAVKVTDNVVRKAPPEWLEELLSALLRVTAPTDPMCYGFAEALLRLAMVPGQVENVRRLAAEGLAWGEVRYGLAEVAEWLAIGQPREHLMAVFLNAQASDELAACLLQETALRYDASAAEGYAQRLRAAGHPLAELPLRPTPAEHGLGLPCYRGPSEGGPPEGGPSGERQSEADGIQVVATEIEWPEAPVALGVFQGWETEAKLLRLERPVAGDDFGASLLRGLGLQSAASSFAGVRFAGVRFAGVRRVESGDVLRTLFRAAAGGGPYGPRIHGAYGRLAAWRSLGALFGVQEKECLWLFYTSDWHLHVHPCMDIGIAALRPDRRTVAILAATNSD